jgi:hypothetical protein
MTEEPVVLSITMKLINQIDILTKQSILNAIAFRAG